MIPRLALQAGSIVLSLTLVFAGLLLERPPWQATIDVGAEGPFIDVGESAIFQNFAGFHSPERAPGAAPEAPGVGGRTFRWTGARAGLTLPWVQQVEPLRLELTICGCRPDGAAVPVGLHINNTEIATLVATAGWRRHRLLVPPALFHPDAGLLVEVRAPVWEDASGRTLGVAIDRIHVEQVRRWPLADPLSAPLLLLGLVGACWWWRRALLAPLLVGGWLVVCASYGPHLVPRWLDAALLLVGTLGLWLELLPRDPAQPARIPALMGAALAVWLLRSPQVLGRWMADDAFISFRYAQHLIAGDGLVFNVGERVEGYTNFLWTLLVAAGMAAGTDPVLVSALLALLLGFGLLALTALIARQIGLAPWAWGAPLLVAVSGPFLLYTSRGSGMETALFSTLILATLAALLGRHWLLAGLLAALTMLTRPDGVLLAGVGGLAALWAGLAPRGRLAGPWQTWGAWGPVLRYSLVCLAIFLPYFGWRWSYYGYPLPNTFYNKVGASWLQVVRGLGYLWSFGATYLLLATGVAGLLAGLLIWRARRATGDPPGADRSGVLLLAGTAGLFCLAIAAVGGDWMPGYRFAVPLVPLLALLTTWGLAELAGLARQQTTARGLMLAGLVGLALLLALRLPIERSAPGIHPWEHDRLVRRYREIGRWIDQNTPPATLLAAPAGALPYYANRPTIDIFGLTDAHIAHLEPTTMGSGKPGHEKGDADYVLGRRPGLIAYRGMGRLAHHPAFQQHYALQEFRGPEGYHVLLYVRDNFARLLADYRSSGIGGAGRLESAE